MRPPNKRGLPMMIPAIDHNKAKEKLQKIINASEPGTTSNNVSLNRKQQSEYSNDGRHNDPSNDDDHMKLIKSLPSFKNHNSDHRRGASYENRQGNSNQREKDNENERNALDKKKRQMSNNARKIIVGQQNTTSGGDW